MSTHTTNQSNLGRSAEDLRAAAAADERNAAESFDRCDTDGFLSQWASGLTAQERRLQASIVENGGTAEFLALFTLDGEWVPAKVVDGRYGQSWMVLDSEGRRTGVYVPYLPARRNTTAKHGFVEGYVTRPACAAIRGSGHGLSGAASCYVTQVATDREWDAPVAIVSPDRWVD